MPILSMFYGIVIRMYFYDDKQHPYLICMPNTPGIERYSASATGTDWRANCRLERHDWCRHRSKSIAKS